MERITLVSLALISGTSSLNLDRLFFDVFKDKEFVVRPRCHGNQPVEVSLDVALRQIIELDEPRQFLSSIAWIRLEWQDCRLVWNSTLYDDIDDIILTQGVIWMPDLTLYDNSAVDTLAGINDFSLRVMNTGTVRYQFPAIIKSLCPVNVRHFPFDYQECRITFGSWAYSGLQIDLRNHSDAADMASFVKNVEWHVLDVPVEYRITWFSGEPYPTVTFVVKLQRLSLFYAMNLIFPCALITTVAMFGFLLPPTSGEKIHLELTVLLSLAVFQLVILELMPPTGEAVSFMGVFFIISLLLVGISCCLTVFVLKLHFDGGDRPLPRWIMRFFVLPMASFFCFDTTAVRVVRSYSIKSGHRASMFSDKSCNSFGLGEVEHEDVSSSAEEPNKNLAREPNPKNASNGHDDVKIQLECISGQLNCVADALSRKTISVSEWIILSSLLDRLFLLLYLTTLLACAISLYITHSSNE